MAQLLIQAIKQWSENSPVHHPAYAPQDFDDELDQELHSLILTAFDKQTKIGCESQQYGSQLLHTTTDSENQAGYTLQPDLWMRKRIEQTWEWQTTWPQL